MNEPDSTPASGPKPSKVAFYVRLAFLAAALAVAGAVFLRGTFGVERVAEEQLRHRISSESNGVIGLNSFRKTNGRSVDGGRYDIEYEAVVVFHSDAYWLSHDPSDASHPPLTFRTSEGGNVGTFEALKMGVAGTITAHFLDRVVISGTLAGVKKERGWEFALGESRIVSGPSH